MKNINSISAPSNQNNPQFIEKIKSRSLDTDLLEQQRETLLLATKYLEALSARIRNAGNEPAPTPVANMNLREKTD